MLGKWVDMATKMKFNYRFPYISISNLRFKLKYAYHKSDKSTMNPGGC